MKSNVPPSFPTLSSSSSTPISSYMRSYAMDSEDKEIDDNELTAKESKAFNKVVGQDHQTSLFRELSLANEVIVYSGTSKILGLFQARY